MTRKELDEAWERHIATTVFVDANVIEAWEARTRELIAAERACVDREAQARAIRLSAVEASSALHTDDAVKILERLACRVERGEVKVP